LAIVLAAVTYFYELATIANAFKFEGIDGFRWGLQLLALYLGAPILSFVLGWLALWNFKWLHPSTRLWRRNTLAVAVALGSVFILINGIYFRAWELPGPLQPPPGPVRLTETSQVKFSIAVNRLYATLPDGRLWLGPRYDVYFSDDSGMRFQIPAGNHGEFIGGSNWMEVEGDAYQEAGIRADGSLWSLQRKWNISEDQWHQTGPFTVAQIGQDTNWSQVASGDMGFWLLKKDGSLWIWGTNSYDWHHGPKAILQKLKLDLATAPTRISDETNWAGLFSQGGGSPFARQNKGRIWVWAGWGAGARYSYALVQDIKMDNQWSSFTILGDGLSFFGVKTNGELWFYKAFGLVKTVGIQLDKHHHWKTVGLGKWDTVMAIREDGTLWEWRSIWHAVIPDPPVQLGEQSDWITLAHDRQSEFALAADGTVWAWDVPSDSVWLAPSRRPLDMGNIFQGISGNP
jgi:hypothetical protein